MSWFLSNPDVLDEAAAKAALMFVVALAGLRVADRRTLSQWTAVDFVTAVAIGAVVGRTAVARTQSFAVGAVALIVLLVVHGIAVRLRFLKPVLRMFEHPVVVLAREGRIDERRLRSCGLTRGDFYAALRQHDVFSLDGVRYVLYEAKGGISIVRESAPMSMDMKGELVDLDMTARPPDRLA